MNFLSGEIKCRGGLHVNKACGCLMDSEKGVSVERGTMCTNPEHEPHKKPAYRKKANDKKDQITLELTGSASEALR